MVHSRQTHAIHQTAATTMGLGKPRAYLLDFMFDFHNRAWDLEVVVRWEGRLRVGRSARRPVAVHIFGS